MPLRLALIAGLLFVEKLLLGLVIDYELARAQQPAGYCARASRWFFRFALAMVAALALFVAARDGAVWRERLFPGPDPPLRSAWLVGARPAGGLAAAGDLQPVSDGAQPLPFAACSQRWRPR